MRTIVAARRWDASRKQDFTEQGRYARAIAHHPAACYKPTKHAREKAHDDPHGVRRLQGSPARARPLVAPTRTEVPALSEPGAQSHQLCLRPTAAGGRTSS